MKNAVTILSIILLAQCTVLLNQDLPDLNHPSKSPHGQKIGSVLDIDTTHIVVAISSENNYSGMFSTFYIEFKPNNKVVVYNSKTRISHPKMENTVVTKMNKNQSKPFFNQLNQDIKSDFYNINSDSLNITTKPLNNRMFHSKIISDGTGYNFWIWQNDNFMGFGTYSPRDFIHEKYPGSNHRKNMLKLQ